MENHKKDIFNIQCISLSISTAYVRRTCSYVWVRRAVFGADYLLYTYQWAMTNGSRNANGHFLKDHILHFSKGAVKLWTQSEELAHHSLPGLWGQIHHVLKDNKALSYVVLLTTACQTWILEGVPFNKRNESWPRRSTSNLVIIL